jgi:hypothetical protein
VWRLRRRRSLTIIIHKIDYRRRRYTPRSTESLVVSRTLPSWNRSMLTEIYLCHACSSCHEMLRTETPGQGECAARQWTLPKVQRFFRSSLGDAYDEALIERYHLHDIRLATGILD